MWCVEKRTPYAKGGQDELPAVAGDLLPGEVMGPRLPAKGQCTGISSGCVPLTGDPCSPVTDIARALQVPSAPEKTAQVRILGSKPLKLLLHLSLYLMGRSYGRSVFLVALAVVIAWHPETLCQVSSLLLPGFHLLCLLLPSFRP